MTPVQDATARAGPGLGAAASARVSTVGSIDNLGPRASYLTLSVDNQDKFNFSQGGIACHLRRDGRRGNSQDSPRRTRHGRQGTVFHSVIP